MMMSQAEYSRHRKVSKAYITNLIKAGKIPPSAWKWEGKKRMIDSDFADRALANNLNPALTRKIKPDLDLSEMKLDDIVLGLNNGDILIDARRAIRELQELLDSPGNLSKKDRLEMQRTIECFKYALTADPDFISEVTPWVQV